MFKYLEILFSDGKQISLSAEYLRVNSPSVEGLGFGPKPPGTALLFLPPFYLFSSPFFIPFLYLYLKIWYTYSFFLLLSLLSLFLSRHKKTCILTCLQLLPRSTFQSLGSSLLATMRFRYIFSISAPLLLPYPLSPLPPSPFFLIYFI